MSLDNAMKFCRKCHIITGDEPNYCAHDGEPLDPDPLATALQESLGAKYALTRLIGTGSMGAVYRAQHHALDEVAIKVMLGPPDNHKLSQRFLREARALRKLRHPHAVLVYDLERSPAGLTYIVMEMIEGRSLRDELKGRGPLTLAEMMEMAEAVCDALEAAHEHGIIHRDLKPDNILLAEERAADGDVTRVVKIVDFGIAKVRGTQQGGEEASMQITKQGAPIGTPFYMSPEQWFGDGPGGFTSLDGRTDIYALGCTLYEALTGYPPFLAKTKDELRDKHLNEPPRPLDEIDPRVPAGLSRVILRALEKDRDFRQATAAEFAAELRRAYDESLEAERKSAEDDKPSPEQMAQMQTTEEADPIIRNWAAEEAQQAIEQVRATGTPATQQPGQQPRPLAPVNGQPAAVPIPEPKLEEFEETLVPPAEPVTQQSRLEELTPETEDEAGGEAREPGRELLVAQVGVWNIGIFADEVERVSSWRAPVPLPHAPPAVLGVVSVRGRMLTVLDPATLLGTERAGRAFRSASSIIVLRGDEQLALAVNRVERNIEVQPDELAPPAEDLYSAVVCGVVRSEHRHTVVLDARELFAAATHGDERRRQRT
ncbi:MAG TPA: protein kinase [Pyrinomonadaceae bacterium]|nr:protein kinase [Pyrinomonadaceae bacterium]